MSVPELSDEARKAVNAAFDAMSAWRMEAANITEKNSEKVIDRLAAAAQAMGWPEQIIATTRAEMQNIAKMQIQTIDRMMDAWEEQIKSPTAASALLSKIKSLPSFGAAGTWPNAEAFQTAAFNPLQSYIQFAEQCQKAWAEAMGFWFRAGKLYDGGRLRRHSS